MSESEVATRGGVSPRARGGAPPRGGRGGVAPGGASRGGPPRGGMRGGPVRGGPVRGGPRGGRGGPRGGGAFSSAPRIAPTDVTVETVKRMDALDLDSHTSTTVTVTPTSSFTSTTSSTSSSTTTSSSSPSFTSSNLTSSEPSLTTSSPAAFSISTTPTASSLAPGTSSTSSTAKKRLSKIVMEDNSRTTSALDVEGLVQTKSAPGKKVGIGNMWAQRMEEQQNEDFQRNRDKLRTRRKGGVAFMDTQIRNLIDEIKRLSHGPGSGMASVTFGVLFKETIDSMPALAATLQCAKKRGVVNYNGDMLMQGTSDPEIITLIKDTIEDSSDFKSVIGTGPIKMDHKPAGPEKCEACGKTVYPTERIAANGKVMHKPCFRCCTCKIVLKLAAYAFNGGKFYCETHFQQMFKQQGYNF